MLITSNLHRSPMPVASVSRDNLPSNNKHRAVLSRCIGQSRHNLPSNNKHRAVLSRCIGQSRHNLPSNNKHRAVLSRCIGQSRQSTLQTIESRGTVSYDRCMHRCEVIYPLQSTLAMCLLKNVK